MRWQPPTLAPFTRVQILVVHLVAFALASGSIVFAHALFR